MPKKSRNIKTWHNNHRKLLVCISGFCLAIFGILCGMFWGKIFSAIMEQEMTLRPNSRVYDNWKNPPLALSLDIYFFNWTNPEDFKNFSTKPILQQLGPYRFIEKPDKVDIQWHPENASVSYRKKSYFYFDAAGSEGSLDDEIVTLNPVALSAANKAKQWSSVRLSLVDVGLKLYGQQISVIRRANELLFDGYSDDMLDVARVMPSFDDIKVPFDKFGWFYTRNGSADLTGLFNIHTGADDIRKIGQMHSWNYKTNTGFFDSYCGETNGSAGEFQPPKLEINGSVSIFTPDMCRTVPLDYVETVEIEGMTGYKYAGGKRSVDNGTDYPENACFCGGECVPSGVMNISSCRFDSPVFMSYPHFYNADPFFVNQVEGLEPQQQLHEFYMILEPHTGIALEVAARFQVNMLVQPIDSISLYDGVPRVFFPLIWFEQKVRITPKLADDLKLLPLLLMGGQIFAGVCFAVGVIMLCWYPIDYLLKRCRTIKMEIQHPTSGKVKSPSMLAAEINELKAPSTPKKLKTQDSSPLLEKHDENSKSMAAARIMPKSETNESIATNTTNASVVTTPIKK